MKTKEINPVITLVFGLLLMTITASCNGEYLEIAEPCNNYEFCSNGLYYTSTPCNADEVYVAGYAYIEQGAKVEIPDSIPVGTKTYRVTGIGRGAFADAPMAEIYMPKSIYTIDANAFIGCELLTTVLCMSPVPPTVAMDAFMESTYGKCTLKVPDLMAYCHADTWVKFYRKVLRKELTEKQRLHILKIHEEGSGFPIFFIADKRDLAEQQKVWAEMKDGLFSFHPYDNLIGYFDIYGIDSSELDFDIRVNGDMYDSDYIFSGLIERCIDLDIDKYYVTFVALSDTIEPARSCTRVGDRSSIALCRWSKRNPAWFRQYLMLHEGSHAIANLNDEYIEYPSETATEAYKRYLKLCHQKGQRLNVTVDPDPQNAPWAFLRDIPGYSDEIGFEEGAWYQHGVWRSTEANGIMKSQFSTFNAMCRYLIIKNVRQRCGIETTIDDFIAIDCAGAQNRKKAPSVEQHMIPEELLPHDVFEQNK